MFCLHNRPAESARNPNLPTVYTRVLAIILICFADFPSSLGSPGWATQTLSPFQLPLVLEFPRSHFAHEC